MFSDFVFPFVKNYNDNIFYFIHTNTFVCSLKQKYSVAGSSQFVPSLNAITSNQDLQWMLQPSLLGTPGPSRGLRPSYALPPRVPSMNPQLTHSHLSRPGVIRAPTGIGISTRSRTDEHVSNQPVCLFLNQTSPGDSWRQTMTA